MKVVSLIMYTKAARSKLDMLTNNKCSIIVQKYFIETSIHGLKYIFESKRHIAERIFWIIAVITLASCGGYLIFQVRLFEMSFDCLIVRGVHSNMPQRYKRCTPNIYSQFVVIVCVTFSTVIWQ